MIGVGVLKGMAVTLRQFVGTYPAGRVLLKALHLPEGNGIFTISYPETKQQHAERFRYFPFLVYDATPDNLRCVACRICEQECPPQCIHITMAKDEQNRPLKANGRTFPAQFDIDVSICMSCRICVDVCPFEAIEMDNRHEIATHARGPELLFDKTELLRSAEYFQQIKPTEAAVVNQRLVAKAAKSQPPKPAAASTPPAA
ncbi:MAG: 4Fe-4S dicluster domain-containing protein [Candidatus Omnitrophica bacterium]|nr:4Fe-4S dicluster domain-containing protein [Candidatus Omnitrophota bacterium]